MFSSVSVTGICIYVHQITKLIPDPVSEEFLPWFLGEEYLSVTGAAPFGRSAQIQKCMQITLTQSLASIPISMSILPP